LIEPERNCFHPQKPGFHQQKLDWTDWTN
jgi:hypothetical protein